jgi:hydroxymethylpyrimidine/phosphomethylpyrimidine kinase
MERRGEPQAKINQAIYIEVTGDDYGGGIDADLKSFLKFGLLGSVGLYRQNRDPFSQDSDAYKIDAKIDALYSARKLIQ